MEVGALRNAGDRGPAWSGTAYRIVTYGHDWNFFDEDIYASGNDPRWLGFTVCSGFVVFLLKLTI